MTTPNEFLWLSEEIKAATSGRVDGDFTVTGISIDSRDIAVGELFVALRAARDGHEFAKTALDAGAGAALVNHIPEGCDPAKLVIVDDVEEALAAMGQFRREQVNAKIVAVTGSAGKTSTKEMLRSTFAGFGVTHASEKSFNNHWGVPLTLARMPKDTQFAIFEIGMNAPGEIAPLVAQVRPDAAIITNVAPVHLAGFGNEEGIAIEKMSIMSGLGGHGRAFVYADMPWSEYIASRATHPVTWYGANSDISQTSIKVSKGKTHTKIQMGDDTINLSLNTTGAHHAINAMAVLGVADFFGLNKARAAEILSMWLPQAGRGEQHQIKTDFGEITLLDESYNANPLSMRAALASLANFPVSRFIAILGDMRELGDDSARFHVEMADWPELQAIDELITVGEEMLHLSAITPSTHFDDTASLNKALPKLLQNGDIVLIKGSNGIGLGKTVDLLIKMGQSQTQKITK